MYQLTEQQEVAVDGKLAELLAANESLRQQCTYVTQQSNSPEARAEIGRIHLRVATHYWQLLTPQSDPIHSLPRISPIAELFERGFELFPDGYDSECIEAHFDLALIYHYLGRQQDCVNAVEKALAKQAYLRSLHPLGSASISFLQTRSGTLTNIGHLANEPEFFIKSQQLGWRPKRVGAVLVPEGHIVNPELLRVWRKYICAITDPRLCRRFASHSKFLEENSFWIRLPNQRLTYYWSGVGACQQQWEKLGIPPLVALDRRALERGWSQLEAAGVPRGSKFITLHVRNMAYMNGNRDFYIAKHRDAEIASYEQAVTSLTAAGYWVIRMGDDSMPKIKAMPKLLDYAHSGLKSDWMDIFLVSQSAFYLGTASGLNGVPINFGVPSVLTNCSPFAAAAIQGKDLYLPKLFREIKSGRLLSFRESFSPPLDLCFNDGVFAAVGVEVVDNTPEEIAEASEEMFRRLNNVMQYSVEDEQLQARFKEISKISEPFGINCRVGMAFLRKYQFLLD